ncbi:MAG: radical SAM protein [Eubacteriales bacterium]
MRILFIVSDTGYYRSGLSNPLGVLSIATYLKKNGYDVKIYDRNIDKTKISILMKSYNPDLVGISVISSRGLKDALKVSKAVKKFGKLIIWGGQMPTMQTELCFDCEYIDYIMMGEGELTWLEFAQKIGKSESLDNIDGIAYKKDEKIIFTKCRDFADLKDLPLIDWTIVNPQIYYQKYIYDDLLYLFSSKGCPFNCSFCGNLGYHRCMHRKRPIDMTLDEIENLVNNFHLKAVYFTDELWCAKKEDAYEFCRKVKERNLKFFWGCDSRADQYSKEDLRIMHNAGCRWLLFGGESGSEIMLKKINKGIKSAGVEDVVKNCKEIGIAPIVTLVVGLPGETEEEVRATVDLGMRLRTKFVLVFHYFPTPGSDMQRKLVEQGLYKQPRTIKEEGNAIAMETLENNFSKVPSKDLRVIRCFFLWAAFTQKGSFDPDNKRTFAFAKETIYDFFNVITKRGVPYFFTGAFSAAKEFLYIFWHVIAYPGVRKKYGLYIRNKH